ncbi:hypothetical protein DICPUDRAFT_82899 [Dictyostelium purpureum]|uniref:Calcineurin-like phosphoesterase domain-containing protein n=1 Tax=Dictyostelium purpureum TaxID=5786 RepID=F0ZXY8_DICPU|nr:uncharacterized protein DICPUDRAFT_82899 [Dictyostelium purpureum]EGC31194.1 hypothetical protein DICPUDRAFT_82899 [Dictyostelium purpureum]|eukprot:XP_003292283.1 hypothetical protein DICPUDRAFT_82899 [Dictyostelium purpureum]
MNCLNKLFIIFGFGLLCLHLYIYNYMVLCRWKYDDNADTTKIIMLGDPQMEGDARIRREGLKGEYNIFFNDNYMKHIVNSIDYFLNPMMVVVLGDLFSSQYITDEEFQKRVKRYDNIFSPLKDYVKIVNITGNHDVGYANEVTDRRINRFEEAFGRVNDKFFFGGHLIGVLNSINLDGSMTEHFQKEAWDHLRELKHDAEATQSPLIIVTHIPLYKDIKAIDRTQEPYKTHPYLCREEYIIHHTNQGFIKDQTMLTPETTDFILNEIKPAFIFNGHDHEGCIYKHTNSNTMEYTIRSMMGSYDGYSALFEFRKIKSSSTNNDNNDKNIEEKEIFEYEFQMCPFLHTKYINITVGVTAGWLVLFILFNIILSIFKAIQRYRISIIKKEQKKNI